jgi:hypothetical protein
MMIRLWHDGLKRTCEVNNERQAKVLAESGWKLDKPRRPRKSDTPEDTDKTD